MLDSLATFDGKLSPLVTMSSNRFRGGVYGLSHQEPQSD